MVLGANGQLGTSIRAIAKQFPNHVFSFHDKASLSINDFSRVEEVLGREKPGALINAAAYTAVDKAESESVLAFALNAEAPGNLAKLTRQRGIQFIHVSTDYVFDGDGTRPYTEEDETNPMGVYGNSKLQGERNVLHENPNAAIVRTSWVFSPFGKNFFTTMANLMASRESISVVNDQHGCPTYAIDLAEALLHMAGSSKLTGGIFHFCNNEPTTWFDFAKAIAEGIDASCKLHPIPSSEYPTPAKRPAYSVLDTKKFRSTFNLGIRPWQEALKDCITTYQNPEISFNGISN